MMEEVLTHGFPAGEVSELCYCGNIIGTIYGGEKDYSEAQGSLFFNIQVISSDVIKANAYCQPKVSGSVKKELQHHQLQCGACTTPM